MESINFMTKKFLVILFSVLVLFTMCTPVAFAASEEGELELTIDVNERYTDIAEEAESDNLFLYGEIEEEEKNVKRNTYVAVLSVALVIAIIILVITLRRVPKEEDIDVSGAEENKNKKE